MEDVPPPITTGRQDQPSARASRISFLLALLLIAAVAAFVTSQISAYREFPFDFDEANHANGALALYLELQAQDFRGFVAEFMSQGFYPPAFSWMKAAAFLMFGASAMVARTFSVVSFVLAMIMVYGVAREIDEDYGWLAGLVAVALTLTMQPLLVTSAMVMMEAPGLLATFALLWFYLRAIKRPTRVNLLSVSLLLILTFFTKYTYGVIGVTTLVVSELALLIIKPANALRPFAGRGGNHVIVDGNRNSSRRDQIVYRWLYLAGPFLVALVTWFVVGGNWQGFLSYATAQPPGQPWITVENLLFYPRSLANHFVPSPVFILMSAVGLVWAIWQWRNPLVRLLLIYFLVGMGVMTVNLPKNPRFIATIVPALHVLTGLALSWSWANRHSAEKPMRLAATSGLVLMVAVTLLSVPTIINRFATYPSLMEVEYETSPQSRDMISWVRKQVPPGERFFLLNYWDQVSPQRIAWDWAAEGGGETIYTRFSEIAMPAALVEEATPENIEILHRQILDSGVSYVVLFEGGAWGLPFWPEYTEATQDILEFKARENFPVTYYDTEGWQDIEVLTPVAWEEVKTNSQYTLDVGVVVYQVIRAP